MNKNWESNNRSTAGRAGKEVEYLDVPLKHRFDVILAFALLATFLFFVLLWGLGIIVSENTNFFDNPPVQQIPENRILTNIRDNIREKPLLDAVLHPPENRFYISQKGGTVHCYNPTTKLWTTEKPFLETNLLNPDLILLRSGSGTAPLSTHSGKSPDPQSLWALSAGNGLVRRIDKKWHALIPDSYFSGSRNKPVSKEQLTAAAVSEYGQWLVLGTRLDGIGIYNLGKRRWLPLPQRLVKSLPSQTITHITWWENRFRIGGPFGLFTMVIDGQTPRILSKPYLKGEIFDLDVDHQNRLWVLAKSNCLTGGGKCLLVSRFQSPGLTAETIIHEKNAYHELNTGELNYAQYWGNQLLLAGEAGIYSYDIRNRNWNQHLKKPIITTLAIPGETGGGTGHTGRANGFFFGYSGGAGVITRNPEPGNPTGTNKIAWVTPLPGQRIIKLAPGSSNGDEALALSLSGKVFSLRKEKAETVLHGGRTLFDPKKFKAAFAFENSILFTGPEGALIHNIVTRSYKDMPTASLPGWLKKDGLRLVTSADTTYALSRDTGLTDIYSVSTKDAAAGNFKKGGHVGLVRGPVHSARDWNGQGIVLLGGPDEEQVLHCHTKMDELTGPGLVTKQPLTLLDVTPYKNGMMAAISVGLHYYDYRRRAWENFGKPGLTFPTEVEVFNGDLLTVTNDNRLFVLDHGKHFVDKIGGHRGFDITDRELSDVLAENGYLFLAGKGKIYLYDPDLRKIRQSWNLPGQKEVVLKGSVADLPLALYDNKAVLGSRTIDFSAGPVSNLFLDSQYIWTVRNNGTDKYVKRYPLDSPFSTTGESFFRNPTAGKNTTKIYDALEIKNNTIAVATNQGLRFYSPEARSWFKSYPVTWIPNGDRLYRLRDVLIVTGKNRNNNGFKITFTTENSIQLPAPLSGDPVHFNNKPVESKVKAFTIDTQNQRVAFVDRDGGIREWKNGSQGTILTLPGSAPERSRLRRIYDRSKHTISTLLFTTDDSIYRYDLDKRTWNEIAIRQTQHAPIAVFNKNRTTNARNNFNDSLESITIKGNGAMETVTVKGKSGKFFTGSFEPGAITQRNNYLRVKQVFAPSAGFNHNGSQLTDVQQRGGRLWTFVLHDRIKYFDPQERKWSQDVKLPGATISTTHKFCRIGGLGVVVEENRASWWVAKNRNDHPEEFARYRHPSPSSTKTIALDSKGTIWRLTTSGELYKIPRPGGQYYANTGTLYEKPFLIRPGNIKRAIKWGRIILFETKKGLRALNTTLRKEIALTGKARSFTGISEGYFYNNRLWLRNAHQILVLKQQRDEDYIGAMHFPYGKNRWLNDKDASRRKAITDEWPRLKESVETLPAGTTVFDPVKRLIVSGSGQLVAMRKEGRELLAVRGAVNVDPRPDPVDVGWLKWDRQRKGFHVKTPAGSHFIKKENCVQNRRFFFQQIEALMVVSETETYAANKHGIMRHSSGNLSLEDNTITFAPVEWSGPIETAHGHFRAGGKNYGIDGRLLAQQKKSYTFTVGDVTFYEDIAAHRVSGKIKTTGGTVDAFAETGLKWDRDRREIYYNTKGGLLMRSEAGYHPVKGYTGFRERLSGSVLAANQTWSNKPETQRRDLIDSGIWKWIKENNKVHIQLKGKKYRFQPVTGAAGYGFSSDRLVDAAVYRDRLYVMTEAFFEEAAPSAELSGLQAKRYPYKPAVGLERIKNSKGSEELILTSRAGSYYWNGKSLKFEKTTRSNNPAGERLLAAVPAVNPILRFRRSGSGAVKKEMTVKGSNGKEAWVTFRFQGKRFPCDVVTSVAADDNYLYVGTAAGLQVYPGPLNTGMGQIKAIYHAGRGSGHTGRLERVTKVGKPLNQPGLVVARFPSASLQSSGNGVFVHCGTPSLLDKRLRLDTPFWRFTHRGGILDGRYKDKNGKISSQIVTLREGRLPHDHIKDIAIYDNRVFTMWANGWLTEHTNYSLDLTNNPVHHNHQNISPRRFVLLPGKSKPNVKATNTQSKRFAGTGVMYIEGAGRRIYRYTGSGWQEVTQPEERAGIIDYIYKPPVIKRRNLELLSPSLTFRHRGLDGKWHLLSWENGRVAIDNWSDLFTLENRVWAATAAGLVSFSRDAAGQVVLDPDDFVVVREPLLKGKLPEITDVSVKNNTVTLRCEADGKQVFQGTFKAPLPGGEAIFSPVEKDPFLEREMVGLKESGFWEWHLKGCRDRNPGWLEGRFRGEEIRLTGGKFGFDTISSLAFLRKKGMEIATETGGWYRSDDGEMGLASLKRPSVPGIDYTEIKNVLLTREKGVPVLGMQTTAGDYIRLREKGLPQRTKGCLEYLCADGNWRYMKAPEDGSLQITPGQTGSGSGQTGSRGGKALRTIEGGRFRDDIVTGLPVTSRAKGGIYYLVPTRGGVLRFDAKLKFRAIHAGPFPGLEKGKSPGVLFVESAGKPLYMSQDGLRNLEGARERYPGLNVQVPEGGRLTAVDNGPQDFVRSRWRLNNTQGWSLSRPGKAGSEGDNLFYIDISQFGKYIKNRDSWGNPGPWLQVRLDSRGMSVFRLGKSEGYRLKFPERIEFLAPIVVDEVLFLIGKQEMIEINLEHAMLKSLDDS
ncbi:MAG: hypothetical protein GY757_41790 [bacterium]|nr:hypothetical protein [bacterium]